MPLFWPEVMSYCSCDPAPRPHLLKRVRPMHWPARKTLKRCSVHVRMRGLIGSWLLTAIECSTMLSMQQCTLCVQVLT